MILTYIKAEVKDRRGRTLSSEKHRSRSFVRGYNHLLCTQFGLTYLEFQTKDTDGVVRSVRNNSYPLRSNGGVGVTTYGIRIGTDNTPVDIEDFALIAPIAEGGGGGQMEHQAVTFNFIGVVGNVCSFEVERIIDNNSGAQINVREAAIYGQGRDAAGIKYFCLSRDLVVEDVPNLGSITITYTVRVVA